MSELIFDWIGQPVVLVIGGILLGLLISLFYIGGPILIYKTSKHEETPELCEVDLETIDFPQEVEEHFKRSGVSLRDIGFEFISCMAIPNSVDISSMVFQYWVHKIHQTSAVITASFSQADSNSPLVTDYSAEFSTCFQDGTVLDSGNTKMFGSMPQADYMQINRMYWHKNIKALYRLHRACTEELESQSPIRFDIEDRFNWDCRAEIIESMQKEFKYAADQGYLWLDSEAGVYRSTLIGAFIMTWSMLPPFRQFIKWNARRKVMQRFRQLDVENYQLD